MSTHLHKLNDQFYLFSYNTTTPLDDYRVDICYLTDKTLFTVTAVQVDYLQKLNEGSLSDNQCSITREGLVETLYPTINDQSLVQTLVAAQKVQLKLGNEILTVLLIYIESVQLHLTQTDVLTWIKKTYRDCTYVCYQYDTDKIQLNELTHEIDVVHSYQLFYNNRAQFNPLVALQLNVDDSHYCLQFESTKELTELFLV